jgi:protoheme IX farnesyltransferase
VLRQDIVQQAVDVQAAVAVTRPERSIADSVRAYVALTKPRIISLLLITTVPAMMLAQGGVPSPLLILTTLIGGTLAAAGANAINCYLDRDIDGVMARTKERPLPSGTVEPGRALLFGISLGLIAFEVLAIGANLLAAALAMFALVFYVFVYTMWLKRSTDQNIVIGGAAGAMPPLVGWAAVTGELAWTPLLLFLIIFLWTPPHFWALALRYRADYAKASVPMMPVVRGDRETVRQIIAYSLVLVACTFALVPVGGMGGLYTAAALLLGGVFIVLAVLLWSDPMPRRSRALFLYSLVYLAALFMAMGADVLVI